MAVTCPFSPEEEVVQKQQSSGLTIVATVLAVRPSGLPEETRVFFAPYFGSPQRGCTRGKLLRSERRHSLLAWLLTPRVCLTDG